MITQEIPRGDSATIPFRLRREGGYTDFADGWIVTMIVKRQASDPDAAAIVSVVAPPRQGATTYADGRVPIDVLNEAHPYAACFHAARAASAERHSRSFTISSTEHS